MIGLVVLALLAIYLGLVSKLTAWVARATGLGPSLGKRFLVWMALLLLPIGDEIVGRLQFAHECRKVDGYTVTQAMQHASLARYGIELGREERLSALIPITKSTSFVVDAHTGEVLLTHATLHTEGGWVMRAGLNMGSGSSCNSIYVPGVMQAQGFKWVKHGIFQRGASVFLQGKARVAGHPARERYRQAVFALLPGEYAWVD